MGKFFFPNLGHSQVKELLNYFMPIFVILHNCDHRYLPSRSVSTPSQLDLGPDSECRYRDAGDTGPAETQTDSMGLP